MPFGRSPFGGGGGLHTHAGNVEGKVTSDRCELKQQARVVGDMKTRSLAMEEGAHLLGRTEIG